MPEFLKIDVSTLLVSLMRLGYYPKTIFEQLNMMATLSVFNKDDCLRLLDTIFRHHIYSEDKALNDELVEKLVHQAIQLSG